MIISPVKIAVFSLSQSWQFFSSFFGGNIFIVITLNPGADLLESNLRDGKERLGRLSFQWSAKCHWHVPICICTSHWHGPLCNVVCIPDIAIWMPKARRASCVLSCHPYICRMPERCRILVPVSKGNRGNKKNTYICMLQNEIKYSFVAVWILSCLLYMHYCGSIYMGWISM
jgi:hypothetical protein